MTQLAKQAKAASRELARLTTEQKNSCLLAMAEALEENRSSIKDANECDMEAGAQARLDAADLAAVVAGDDHHIARMLGHQPLHEIRPGVDFHLPGGGIFLARVEAVDAAEVREQVRPEWRENMHAMRHARQHLLLEQRGVEMTGIKGDQANVARLISRGTHAKPP